MPAGYERKARKWAMQRLTELGTTLPVNASYMDVAVEAIKHARELIGRPAIVDGANPHGLLAAMYFEAEMRNRRMEKIGL
jgi:hypothetical protein